MNSRSPRVLATLHHASFAWSSRRAPALWLSAAVLLAAAPAALAGETTRVSVKSNDAQATGFDSFLPSISATGRFVAFESSANNLVAGDTNRSSDAFVRDRKSGTTTRVSVDSNGAEATGGGSGRPAISANGRFVAFSSVAPNLAHADMNGFGDVFVRDRRNGTTTRVSVDSAGAEASGGDSTAASISANGRFVAFESAATSLVPADANGTSDVFVRDRKTGKTTRVSVDSTGAEATGGSSFDPSISASGRFVAFDSSATNLVAGDTNLVFDVFVHDRKTGETTRVSVDSTGAQTAALISARPSISANGRFVAFRSDAGDLVLGDNNGYRDVFVRDRKNGKTTRVSIDSTGAQATGGDSGNPSISASGRFVAFESFAPNLVAGDTNAKSDIFVHDRKNEKTTRVSVDSTGAEATGGASFEASLSANGRFVSFDSDTTNLVAGDTNAKSDIFVHDRK